MKELERHLGIDQSKCVRTQAFWREAGKIKSASDRSTIDVLHARYTEAGDVKASYAEIADQFSVKESRARELVVQALRRMRHIADRYTVACGSGIDEQTLKAAQRASEIFSFIGPAEELAEKVLNITCDDLHYIGQSLSAEIGIPNLNVMAFLEWVRNGRADENFHGVYEALKMRYNFAGNCRATYAQIAVRSGLTPIVAKAVIQTAVEVARADLDESVAEVYHGKD